MPGLSVLRRSRPPRRRAASLLVVLLATGATTVAGIAPIARADNLGPFDSAHEC